MGKNIKAGKSALRVMGGIQPPASFNEEGVKQIRNLRQKKPGEKDMLKGILSDNRTILGQAITLVESTLESDRQKSRGLIESCLPYSGDSIRIGITGVPGVGKSTFIEAFGTHLTSSGHKVAVLAVDPSSERSKGSILGDKTRMEDLAKDKNAFIRPSPTGGSPGGVARKTRESIILCEAAGYDIVIIETVGVGQSETAVHSMTDFFLLLMLAGAGDELQGIKRGIMEMADMVAINKADGNNVEKAVMAKAEYERALHLFPAASSGRKVKVITCSALTREGIPLIYKDIIEYRNFTSLNNYFQMRRAEQSKYWMNEFINERLSDAFFGKKEIKILMKKLEKEVMSDQKSPFTAAGELLEKYFNQGK